jgi:hypothetical protein
MNRSKLGRAVFSAALALVFAFGAQQAMASPQHQDSGKRPYCEDEADCQATCDRLYPGQERVGICSEGHTCYCY